ncbi:MAG: CPBP family intramembrane metalloprotease [Spirochaetales bacterium]|nr:CPBP family intramembrane metalloprotease [Spirochaetales bacterium]
MKRIRTTPMWQYVIRSYLAFFFIVLVLGGMAFLVFGAESVAMTAVQVLGAWSPTIVLLLMLKKLKPGTTIKDFYRGVFRERLNLPSLIAIPLMVFGVFLASVWLVSVIEKTSLAAQLRIPAPLVGAILLMALRGPSGEESGWRGYLRPELEGRYGFIKGNLILGLVWAFWHTPTWIVDLLVGSGAGLQFAVYIVANLVVMTALTFIMGIFMKRCNNLLIAFWIHYCFNLSLLFSGGSVYFFAIFSVLYAAVALALLRFFHTRTP